MTALNPLFKRECLLMLRQPRQLIYVFLFFLLIILIFPLCLPPDNKILPLITPALLWMTLLLAMLRSTETFFQQEHQDGVLEQWLINKDSLILILLVKLFVAWFMTVLPLIIVSPMLLIFYHYEWSSMWIQGIALLLGSPALLSVCALAAVFGLGIQQKGVMMALIVFPLVIPIIILGAGTSDAFLAGQPLLALFALLAAMSTAAIILLPFAIAAILKVSAGE